MRWRVLGGSALLAVGCGCGWVPAGLDPLVEAHRGGAAEYPQNGLSAVRNTVAKGYEGIEFDIVLTRDLVPIISHDPWVNHEFCTHADGTPLAPEKDARLFLRDLTLEEAQRDYLCGGIGDPVLPDVTRIAEPMITLAQLLEELRPAPELLVHLDVKYEPGMTEPADVFAEEILAVWRAAALPNPWYVTVNTTEGVRAFEDRSSEFPGGIPTAAVWPTFPVDSNSTAVALGNEFAATVGFTHLLSVIEAAHSDGIAIAYQVADRAAIQAVRDRGFDVRLWTLNSAALLEAYCDWPVDGLITDMPAEAPCR